MKNIKIRQILGMLFFLGIIAILLRTFIVDNFIVRGDSMAPTVLDGDWVFVDRISYHFFRDPSREDIIVVKPRSLDAKIIKRIIGLPGEQIEIANGRVKIKDSRQDQGRILSEVYLSLPSAPTIGANVISLDPKEYFMLGDNRYVSTDSRELGPIDEWNIKGRVFLIFRPKYLSFKFFK